MTERKSIISRSELKQILLADGDFLKGKGVTEILGADGRLWRTGCNCSVF